jgi:hypothetical protein
MGLAPLGQKVAQTGVGLGRSDNLQLDPLVARLLAARMPDPAPAQPQDPAGTRARRNCQAHRAVDGGGRDLRPEDRLVDGDRQGQHDVVAVAPEHRMGPHEDRDQRVPGRPAAKAGRPLATQPQGLPVLGAARDLHREGLAVGQRDPGLGPAHRVQKRHLQRVARIATGGRKPALAEIACGRACAVAQDLREDVRRIGVRTEAAPLSIGVVRRIGEVAVVPALRSLLTEAVDLARVKPSTGLWGP